MRGTLQLSVDQGRHLTSFLDSYQLAQKLLLY